MPGGAGQNQQQNPAGSVAPILGEVLQITNLIHLQKIIKDYGGVAVMFWGQNCPACVRFKPTFEAAAKANPNKNIVFCSVNCEQNRDTAQAYQVTGIPQLNFFLNGEQSGTFKGGRPKEFRENIGVLYAALSGKSREHMLLDFK